MKPEFEHRSSPVTDTWLPRSDSRGSELTLTNMSDSDSEMHEKGRNGDVEKLLAPEGRMPTITTKDHTQQDPLARAKLFMWMFLNTVATVFIVSAILIHCYDTVNRKPMLSAKLVDRRAVLSIADEIPSRTGLLQQSHLHRSIIYSMPSRLCSLPFLHHDRHTLHSFSSCSRDVCS